MGQGGSSEQQRSPYDDLESSTPASVPPAASAPSRLSLIPTVLQWQHGGRAVFVTGTFNNWAERIPMRQSRSDFTVCLNLPVGTFQYKFIVDNEWRFSPSQPLVQDTQGNVNNCITVLDEEVRRGRRAPRARRAAPRASARGARGPCSRTRHGLPAAGAPRRARLTARRTL
jgi:5'-AMP-activated protein kinase regulatory beta subunit